jgi:hypothetical protein
LDTKIIECQPFIIERRKTKQAILLIGMTPLQHFWKTEFFCVFIFSQEALYHFAQ